jgi:hypothetical protein
LDRDFIRKQYDHELDRQDKIVAGLSLPIAVLTALGGFIGAMLRGFSEQFMNLTYTFYALIAIDCAVFAAALYFIRRAFFGQTYEYLPRLGELEAHYKALIAYHVQLGQTQTAAEDLAKTDFQEYLTGKIIQAGQQNALSNDDKSAFRYYANWSVVSALVVTFLAGIPYVMDSRNARPAVPTVHIDNLGPVITEVQNARDQAASAAAAAAAPDGAGEQNREGRDAAGPGADGKPIAVADPKTPAQPTNSTPQKPVGPENRPTRSEDPSKFQQR